MQPFPEAGQKRVRFERNIPRQLWWLEGQGKPFPWRFLNTHRFCQDEFAHLEAPGRSLSGSDLWAIFKAWIRLQALTL